MIDWLNRSYKFHRYTLLCKANLVLSTTIFAEKIIKRAKLSLEMLKLTWSYGFRGPVNLHAAICTILR